MENFADCKTRKNYSLAHKYMIRDLPTTVLVGKNKKPWYLNLNIYRNTHGAKLGKIKNQYNDMIANNYSFPDLLFGPPYKFEYTIFFATKICVDLMNYGSIIDKFVSDALVKNGLIEDDNRLIIPKVSFIDGGVVRGRRFADLLIKPY